MNSIQPSESGAFVYHDGLTIRGISFVVDDELAEKFQSFHIPVETASEFVTGNLDPARWFIWQESAGPILYNDSVLLSMEANEDYVKLTEQTPTGQPWIAIKIYPDHVAFQLITTIPFKTHLKTLDFIVAKRNDPSAVLFIIKVPTDEFFTDQLYDVAFPHALIQPIDIYTRRLFPGYGIEYLSENDVMLLSLPKGHFIDIVKVGNKPIKRGLQVIVDQSMNAISINLIGAAVPTYNRSMNRLKFLFSVPNDPSLILDTMEIPIDQLREGLAFPLPDILRKRSFDLWTPLLYRNHSMIVF